MQAEYSKALDNASRRGTAGVGGGRLMRLFRGARGWVFANRLCRSSFRSSGIYPYNPEAALKIKPDENRISSSELILAISSTATTDPFN